MNSTAFDSNRLGVLFFSRGRGRGHAVPDVAIARELSRLRNDLDLRFVSYDTGARTLAGLGYQPVDLALPDQNPVMETLIRAARVISALEPAVVIAHEEFAALPAAKISERPTAFLTEWFTRPEDFSMRMLAYADEVLFLEEAGLFEEPPTAFGKVRYAGPVVPAFSYSRADRARARRELDLPPQAVVVAVFPGSWTEAEMPALELILAAYEDLAFPEKRLIWVAGADYEHVVVRVAGRSDVQVREHDWRIERLMVAADAAITKSNRQTIRELASLGIPSVSLSAGRNPIDDEIASRIPANRALRMEGLDAPRLAKHLVEACAEGQRYLAEHPHYDGRIAAARMLSEFLERAGFRPG